MLLSLLFGLLSSSWLLLFTQRFGQLLLRPSSGVDVSWSWEGPVGLWRLAMYASQPRNLCGFLGLNSGPLNLKSTMLTTRLSGRTMSLCLDVPLIYPPDFSGDFFDIFGDFSVVVGATLR